MSSVARLPQHAGAYTRLFTFAVTVKNNLGFSGINFDDAKRISAIMRLVDRTNLTAPRGYRRSIQERLVGAVTVTLLIQF